MGREQPLGVSTVPKARVPFVAGCARSPWTLQSSHQVIRVHHLARRGVNLNPAGWALPAEGTGLAWRVVQQVIGRGPE